QAKAAGPTVSFASPVATPSPARAEDASPKTAMALPGQPAIEPARSLPGSVPAEQVVPALEPAEDPAQPTDGNRPPVDQDLPGNPFVWRSVAAMVVTCVGLPLAYWSRNLAPANRAKSRARLPGPAQQSGSPHGESDA